ncbi:PIN domain-containing protein [Halobaculum sp. MBLA0147]|uniref:PIN domain-containing protein n=1 Tax=Halobaculum sp. MBLA0147 TaxID=3079934 RepID=UPI00352449DA
MIVDTSYVLDLLGGNREAFEAGEELVGGAKALKIPTMTIVELFVGYGATGDEDEAREVENALRGHPVVEMDQLIARRAGTVAGRTGLDFGDAVIGATAIQLDEPVLTGNVTDFETIDGVEITTY